MEFEHSFTIPVPPDKAWDVLLDVRRVAPCMPGAAVDSVDGDDITGHVRVKVGPITMTYAGHARFVDRDPAAHTVTLEASGKESRGTGTASATVHAALHGENGQDGHTTVTMNTILHVTGRPAQMGRGVLADVSGKLVERFAANLAEQLAAAGAPSGDTTAGDAVAQDGGAGTAAPAVPAQDSAPAAVPARKKEDESLNLLGVATGPVMRRLVPGIAAAVAAVLASVFAVLRRRRRTAK
jgi:uncharacterized protein